MTIEYYCSLSTFGRIDGAGQLRSAFLRVSEMGCTGVELWPTQVAEGVADAARDAGLSFGAACYLPEDADPRPVFESAAAAGAAYIECQVDGYWRDDEWVLGRVDELTALARQYSRPFHLETHRGRITQDPRRCLWLLQQRPGLSMNGDFSHYVSTCELKAPWSTTWNIPLQQIARRCGMLHIRLNNGQRVQDPFAQVGQQQRNEFLNLWQTAVDARCAAHAANFVVTTELLTPDYQIVDHHGRPQGDLINETSAIIQWLRDSLSTSDQCIGIRTVR